MPSQLNSPVLIIALIVAIPVAALNLIGTTLVVGSQVVQQFHAPVTSKSLARSVSWEADSAFIGSGRCVPTGDAWGCDIVDSGGSGYIKYGVEVEPDSSCWKATFIDFGGEAPPDRVLEGCVNHFEGGWYGKLFG